MNWTPGPWKIDTDTQGYVVIVAGKRTVCLVGPEEDPTSETDAAAIVLLPELAEALRHTLARLAAETKDVECCDLYPSTVAAMNEARAILAKLEGGGK